MALIYDIDSYAVMFPKDMAHPGCAFVPTFEQVREISLVVRGDVGEPDYIASDRDSELIQSLQDQISFKWNTYAHALDAGMPFDMDQFLILCYDEITPNVSQLDAFKWLMERGFVVGSDHVDTFMGLLIDIFECYLEFKMEADPDELFVDDEFLRSCVALGVRPSAEAVHQLFGGSTDPKADIVRAAFLA